jgi:general secretion pathway protein D
MIAGTDRHRTAGCERSRTRALWAVALLVALSVCAAGCAAATANRHAQEAEHRQDYDRAVVEYTKALRLDPNNTNVRLALDRSKIRASEDHFQRGRRFSATGKYDQALVEYELAAELNPTNGEIDQELRTVRNRLRAKITVAAEGKTELETLVERTRELPPSGLDLPQNVKMPASLVFRDASSRDVFVTMARIADISIVFDPTFRESPISLDLRNASLDTSLNAVNAATRTFFRVTAPRTIVIVPDTPAKRREYEEEVVRTFYLSNADVKETMDLLRMVVDARRVSAITGTNAIALRDTPEHIAAASRLIGAIDKARPEVIIDVELLEVDRTRLQEYGLQVASPGSSGINGSASVKQDTTTSTITLQSLRNLTQADILLANLPSLYYRLLKSDSNTRTLANPQLRTSDGMAAQARFGERVPVPVTTFAPIATGGTAQQPITSFNYENIGVNIDITPRTHHDDDVTLALKIEVSSVSGTGYGGLPTFGNRQITTVIRLKDGETNMLAGLIRDDERRVLEGLPGLSDIPIVGRIFVHDQKSTEQTDIILTLTPHIIRVLDLTEADLRPFRVGGDVTSPIAEAPVPLPEPPAAPQAPRAPEQQAAPPPSEGTIQQPLGR